MTRVISKRLSVGALLIALGACGEKKPAPTSVPTATASVPTVTPIGSASAAPAAAETPKLDEATILALRKKYEAPTNELIAAVVKALADEVKKQKSEGARLIRLPLPATKLSKDPDVLDVIVVYTNEPRIDVESLNGSPLVTAGPPVFVPAKPEEFNDRKARCPSEYTNEPAVDLMFSDGWQIVVVVKTDACRPALGQRDERIERARKMAEPLQKEILAHAAKTPAKCETPTSPTEISPALKEAGFVKARMSCRNPSDVKFKWDREYESKYHKGRRTPAWRPTIAGWKQTAFYLTEDADKPFQMTFSGMRSDRVEVAIDFYRE